MTQANPKNVILNGDVLVQLKKLNDSSVDLVIADPPYGIEKDFGKPDSWQSLDDWKGWCWSWLTECERILKPNGSILLYGISHYICFNQVQLYELGMRYRRQIIWHYENGFCGNRNIRATYEPLLWFSKSDDFFFREIREPYKSADRLKYSIKKNGKTWTPNPEGRLAGDVWNIPTLAGRRFRDEKVGHPTQKPLAISERLVDHFCPEDGTILIPFAGSGSECVAAFEKGRNFIGIELNEEYCSIAERRLTERGWPREGSLPEGHRVELDHISVAVK